MLMTIAPFGIIAQVRAHRIPSVSRVSGNRQTTMSVWLRNGSSWSGPAKIFTSSPRRGERTQADIGNPSAFSTNAGAFAIRP